MAKEKAPITAKIASDPVDPSPQKPVKPKALDVAAPQLSSEVDGTVVPSRMPGSYLTVDPRMDSSPITVKFSAKDAPELVLEDIVDSSGQSGARKIAIPLAYLTTLMGFTALISYTGKAQGQAAQSSVKEVGISFYPASESENLAPYLLHEKIVHNTPTYDMHDHTGDETVLVPVPPLAKAGDRVYCTAVTEQDVVPYKFYTVIYGHELTAEEAVAGHVLRFSIARGWLARRKPWRSITLQSAWITSGLPAEPPVDVDPHLETRLPANALEIQRRRTAALIVAPGLDLPPPHLRQSVDYNGGWHLNPELTKEGGDVDVPGLDTYAGDRVCFFVGGPGFAKKPLGCVAIEHDGDPASVKLSACIVACLFNKSMTLTYTLAFNESEQSSPAQDVSVSVPRFVHPNIEEATNGTVDLSTFKGGALATVPVWAYAECSNLCWMWITGKDGDGSVYRFDILRDEPVTHDWKAKGVEAPIPRAELQKLADCSEFELHFAVSFCEVIGLENAREFPAQAFKVEQEPLDLLKPSVTEAVDDDLTVWNGRDGVHVEVDYVGKHPGHSISVCWSKPDGSCLPLPAQPGSDSVFFVPPEAVIESMGKTIKITYTVTSACKVQISPPLNLQVSVAVRLPKPAVKQATPYAIQGGILDTRTFPGDADVVVNKWWFLLLGQHGWLECRGTDENGLPYTIQVATGHAITEPEVSAGLDMKLLRTELEKLRNKTPLVVSYEGTPDVAGVRSNAIQFPVLNLEFRKAFYHHTDFDPAGKGWNGWQRGPGASDLRDLIEKTGAVPGKPSGYFLFDWGYTNTTSPATQSVKLFQTFTGLEVGRQYKFSAWVRDNSGVGNKPRLVLTADGVDISPVTLPARTWEHIQGVFTAASSSASLTFENRQMGIYPGNDFDVTQVTVEEL
ncbi:hypothetical protein [Pseudomonas sp. KBW05]|uniref:hypothetical protein n=1 Tax=Pseudomonas sp. KBW05 TaxID=2153360 RepID=UPI0015AD54C0|nr:hypothetical protein [Pseudomonas sp. KBW05]